MTTATNSSNLGYVAFATTASLAVATIASSIAVATVATTVATVAYAILALTTLGCSIASITAYMDPGSKDVQSYFTNVKNHSGYALAGVYHFAAHVAVQAVVEGFVEGIKKLISRKIAGPDVTVGQVRV